MNDMEITKCRSCNADIFWIEYKGKKHPVNAKAILGFIKIHITGKWVMEKSWISHFATCPDAQKWRNKKK